MDLKKYIAPGLCVILTITGGVLSANAKTVQVEIGAGKGKSERVETVAEFADAWDAAGTLLLGLTDNEPLGAKLCAASMGENTAKEYTSVTIALESQSTSKNERTGEYASSTKSVMDRTMTCSFTQTESYYNVDATMYNYTYVGGDDWTSTTTTLDLCFEMYVNKTEAYSAIRFDRFKMSVTSKNKDGEYDKTGSYALVEQICDAIEGRWLSSDMIGGENIFQMVNTSNYAIFETFGKYLDMQDEEGVFVKNGKMYTLTEEAADAMLLELVGSVLGGIDATGVAEQEESQEQQGQDNPFNLFSMMFTADLSIATQPNINCLYSVGYKLGDMTFDAFERQNFALKNINNTVIKNAPKKAVLVTASELQNIMNNLNREGK